MVLTLRFREDSFLYPQGEWLLPPERRLVVVVATPEALGQGVGSRDLPPPLRELLQEDIRRTSRESGMLGEVSPIDPSVSTEKEEKQITSTGLKRCLRTNSLNEERRLQRKKLMRLALVLPETHSTRQKH